MGKPTPLLVLIVVFAALVVGSLYYFITQLNKEVPLVPKAVTEAVTPTLEAPLPAQVTVIPGIVPPVSIPVPSTSDSKNLQAPTKVVNKPVKVVKSKRKVSNKEATAYLQAYLNAFIHDCLRDVVDYKIDADVAQGQYRDFGNVLTFYHDDPKNFLRTAIFTNLCHLPETDTSLAKGGDRNAIKF